MKKKNKYSLIIFDLDGTLLDTLPDLAGAVNYALKTHGRQERTIEEVRRFISNGVRKLIERSLFITEKSKDTNDYIVSDRSLFDVVFSDFVKYYLEHVSDHTEAYAGMQELVRRLKAAGMKTAVITNKREDAAVNLMDAFYPGGFDMIIGDGPGRERKPSPASVLLVMEKLGMSKEETVYVGDSDVDLATAVNAGVDAVLVTWGYRNREFLVNAGAQIIVDTTEELEMILHI
ncbi:MAG: HAD-IA family hydrolase [Lachnospiraceae bacterium]|nr:HAD-IA family hydrolase [Lachnospiraceae bacterium]